MTLASLDSPDAATAGLRLRPRREEQELARERIDKILDHLGLELPAEGATGPPLFGPALH